MARSGLGKALAATELSIPQIEYPLYAFGGRLRFRRH
jgi:hypothetical protein